jgi:hypothetical protein
MGQLRHNEEIKKRQTPRAGAVIDCSKQHTNPPDSGGKELAA